MVFKSSESHVVKWNSLAVKMGILTSIGKYPSTVKQNAPTERREVQTNVFKFDWQISYFNIHASVAQ